MSSATIVLMKQQKHENMIPTKGEEATSVSFCGEPVSVNSIKASLSGYLLSVLKEHSYLMFPSLIY